MTIHFKRPMRQIILYKQTEIPCAVYGALKTTEAVREYIPAQNDTTTKTVQRYFKIRLQWIFHLKAELIYVLQSSQHFSVKKSLIPPERELSETILADLLCNLTNFVGWAPERFKGFAELQIWERTYPWGCHAVHDPIWYWYCFLSLTPVCCHSF